MTVIGAIASGLALGYVICIGLLAWLGSIPDIGDDDGAYDRGESYGPYDPDDVEGWS